jgi:hypothetical protein
MKKIIAFLLIVALGVHTSFAQCTGVGLNYSTAYLGASGANRGCMSTNDLVNSVVVNLRLGGTNACQLSTKLPSGDEVIYWPKGKQINWDIFSQRKDKWLGGASLFGYCGASNFVRTGPDGFFALGGTQSFTPQQTGLYQLSCVVHLQEDGITFPLISKQITKKIKFCWTSPFPVITACASFTRVRYDPMLSMNICVVDVGGGGSITTTACGNNELYRPANTADYSYFWQTTPYGTEKTYGDVTFKVNKAGTYYLRARHNATLYWGDATSFVVNQINTGVVVNTPPVPTVNGSTCGNVTLTMPPAPSGITYYWQGTVCPSSDPDKIKSPDANTATHPYTDVLPGKTYYVAATNGACWSACVAVTPTVNPISPPVVSDQNYCICDFPSGGVTISPTLPAGANTFRWYTFEPVGNPIPIPTMTLVSTGPTLNIPTPTSKTYFVRSYNSTTTCLSQQVAFTVNFKNCTTCRESFSPIAGEKYVLSAWVKENNNFDITTYTNPSIKIIYGGAIPSSEEFKGSGEIIEGWQKIEKEFVIPAGSTGITIELNNGGVSEDVFFDDIRVFPFRSNMVSYVYNPYTLKLIAELDANNYATYYTYDDEGKLTMVKKETTNGIKTLKEGRSGNVIK